MKHIPGAILAVCIFAWLTFLGTNLVNGQQAMNAADSYLADICKEISESNYAPDVINACGSQAKTSGYAMTITLYSDAGTKTTCSYASGASGIRAPEPPDTFVMAEIRLDYKYSLPILGINQTHSVRGMLK